MNSSLFRIEKIVNGGSGLTRTEDGQIVLIRHVLPGELVTATVTREKKGYAEACATAIIEPSPHRLPPPCPKYGTCGGCDLQCCAYDEQLRLKKAIIHDLLQRAPDAIRRQSIPLLADPLASPRVYGYRQRIRLRIDADGRLGFHQFHGHRCVPVTQCLLAAPELNAALTQLLLQPAFHRLFAITTELELLLNPETSQVICLLHLTRRPRPADMQQAAALAAALPSLAAIGFHGRDFQPITHPRQDTIRLQLTLPAFPGHTRAPLSLSWEVGGFCQVNLEQNVHLVRTVLDFCQADPDTTILDLFCGMGNFSLPLAMHSGSVLGLEGQGAAIRSARENSARAGLANTRFEKGPIHQHCRQLIAAGRSFDCTVIDPPRQGAPELAPQLAQLTRRRLVYVSCDPATLCRDLAALIAAGFTVTRLQPIDMFPHTHHIETVALLEKTAH